MANTQTKEKAMAQLTPNSTVRAYDLNGGHVCMAFSRQKDGQYRVTVDAYDSDGYYRADRSREVITNWETIESEVAASQSLSTEGVVGKVEIYN